MNASQKNVLITGVSSGIGLATAHALLRAGYRVIGGVRKPADAEALKRAGGAAFDALSIDMADASSIDAAIVALTRVLNGAPLHALINNAGIALPGPLAEQAFDDVRTIFEVNFFGLLHLTRGCLPLLGMNESALRDGSTIINVSSTAGKVAFPFLGAYVASKHAVEGVSASLRRELLPWNIRVVVVGPGNVKTPIWNKGGEENAYDHTLFGATYRSFRNMMRDGESKGMEPEQIAQVILEALESPHPKTRYEPVAQRFANWTLPRLLSDKMLDKMLFRALGMKAMKRLPM